MIVMLDTPQDIAECGREMGCKTEQLLSPPTQRKRQYQEANFCIDNGAFGTFEKTPFLSILNREFEHKHLCRFVAVPDVVGSAIRTLEVFHQWKKLLGGWNLAFVCQDGQEYYPIPWDECDAIFIGGSTEWKLSKFAVCCIKAAKMLGKWVHVGRVNTPDRYDFFKNAGADSIDGTGLARYTHMRLKFVNEKKQTTLFT